MASFQEGNLRDLLLQIMARGLDISNITHVINFEMPAMPELYMHIGRTGRADKTGTAISLLHQEEEAKKLKS
jgi:ATP-dependent RNA helicase RhlE